LPYRLLEELRAKARDGRIEEIRLRRGRRASLTLPGKNLVLNTVLDGAEIDGTLTGMCSGSLYAYSDTINKGYVSLPGGVRVGVCGRANCEGERMIGVHEISSLVIRIPHRARRVGEVVCRLLREFKRERGVLIYSPPGVGKTTLLRGIISLLSSGEHPLRTAVVDTRGELAFSVGGEDLCVDVLSGYPRALGIEIATRTLSAEVIVCDEIGDYTEAMALVSSHNCGVPLIASAHAGSAEELLRRTGIMLLHEANIFGAYVGISRSAYGDFEYDVHYRDDLRIL
jgi:stage III sporulation protein AA